MRNQTIKYYLKKDGEKKKYNPTKKEMGVIMKDIEGILQYMIGEKCKIYSVNKNVLTFGCENSVFDEYGDDVLLHPDDDGNYYVERKDKNGKTIYLGWHASLIKDQNFSNSQSKTRKNRKTTNILSES